MEPVEASATDSEPGHDSSRQNGAATYQTNLATSAAGLKLGMGTKKDEDEPAASAAARKQLATMTDQRNEPQCNKDELTIRPTYKRFLILLLFALNAANKSYQWLQVPSSTTKATLLYDTDNYVINLASTVFMVSFVVLSWPACYIIESLGVRRAVVLASLGTATGATIKCFSCHASGIWLLMAGQILVSLSEQLIFSLPSRLASIWFPDHQVSLCVALCVVGGQVGLAMGFLVPQWFLEGRETRDEIAAGFQRMFLATALFSISIFLICMLFFDEAPAHVPGAARRKQLQVERAEAERCGQPAEARVAHKLAKLFAQIRQLFQNRQLVLLSTSYGIVVGVGYTIQTLLDQMLKPIWPQDDLVVGNTGFLIIVAGILSTPIWGRAMDRWHAFKSINLIIATGALLSLILFSYAMVALRSPLGLYVAAVLFGLFHTGFLVSGLEYAVELTYPMPELVTSSAMNLMPSLYGIFFVFMGSYITDNHGVQATNIFHVSLLLLGLVLLLCTRETLRRQEAITQLTEKPAARGRPHAHA